MTNSKNKTLIILFTLIFFNSSSNAKISESELTKITSKFMSKLISENSNYKYEIIETLNSVVKRENSGIKLVDKIGFFIMDSQKNGISINKTKFFYNKSTFFLNLIFKDSKSGEYILFLEYEFIKLKKVCKLKDVYFSFVFDEKKKEIEDYFRYR